MWERQLSLADAGWRVVIPQLRGFDGGAEPPVSSIDDYAGDIIDLLDAQHIDDAVIGGLSLGGYLAFAVLRHAASYVHALILADTKSQADTPEAIEGRKRLLKTLEAGGASAGADEIVPKLGGETTRRERPDVVAPVPPPVLAHSREAITRAIPAVMSPPPPTPPPP